MKKYLLLILLFIFKWHLRIIYFFIKLFTKQKKQVFFLSRQFDEIPLNYQILIDELKKDNIEVKVICKKVSSGVNSVVRNEKKNRKSNNELISSINYYFNLYKQMVYASTSKVIIVDGYNIVASLLNHKKNTKIIQLWHALAAIKKFGYQTIGYPDGMNPSIAKMLCMHKNYDYVISGSKAMNKYFAEAFNVDVNKVKEIGTPTIDYLLQKDLSTEKKIYKEYPQMKKKLNILYSPTFRSDGRDNTQEVIDKFDTKKYNLILTFHPKNEIKVNKDVICVDRNKFSTFDILKIVDYVITDYSALAMDACVLNKKLMFYVYDYEQYKKENGINIDLFKELPNCTSKDITDLIEILDNNSYNEKGYQKFRKKFITNLNGGSTKELIQLIEENL